MLRSIAHNEHCPTSQPRLSLNPSTSYFEKPILLDPEHPSAPTTTYSPSLHPGQTIPGLFDLADLLTPSLMTPELSMIPGDHEDHDDHDDHDELEELEEVLDADADEYDIFSAPKQKRRSTKAHSRQDSPPARETSLQQRRSFSQPSTPLHLMRAHRATAPYYSAPISTFGVPLPQEPFTLTHSQSSSSYSSTFSPPQHQHQHLHEHQHPSQPMDQESHTPSSFPTMDSLQSPPMFLPHPSVALAPAHPLPDPRYHPGNNFFSQQPPLPSMYPYDGSAPEQALSQPPAPFTGQIFDQDSLDNFLAMFQGEPLQPPSHALHQHQQHPQQYHTHEQAMPHPPHQPQQMPNSPQHQLHDVEQAFRLLHHYPGQHTGGSDPDPAVGYPSSPSPQAFHPTVASPVTATTVIPSRPIPMDSSLTSLPVVLRWRSPTMSAPAAPDALPSTPANADFSAVTFAPPPSTTTSRTHSGPSKLKRSKSSSGSNRTRPQASISSSSSPSLSPATSPPATASSCSSATSPTLPLPGRKLKSMKPTSYTCTFPGCDKIFPRSYNLTSHMRTHSRERPFLCNTCPLSFARRHDRERHVRLHTGEKPYMCNRPPNGTHPFGGCGAGFMRNDALLRHLKFCTGPRTDVPWTSTSSLSTVSEDGTVSTGAATVKDDSESTKTTRVVAVQDDEEGEDHEEEEEEQVSEESDDEEKDATYTK